MRKEYTLYNLHGFSRENNPDFLYYFDLLHYWWFNFSEAVRGKGKCHIEYSSDDSIIASLYHLQLRRQWPSQLRSISVGEVEYNWFSFQIS